MPTGAELFVRTLAQLQISQLFTLVGDHLNEVLMEAARAACGSSTCVTKSAVVHAADALARVTRKPALTLVTGGPGHTNSLTGIATAYLNCSPVIAVSGSLATNSAGAQRVSGYRAGRDGASGGEVGRTSAKSRADPILPGSAYNEANSGRKGPVHFTIPVDVFTGQTDQSSRAPEPLVARSRSPTPARLHRPSSLSSATPGNHRGQRNLVG